MKTVLLLAWALLISSTVFALPTEKSSVYSKNKARLGTSFQFDGSALHGKYQTPPGTTAKVENDKYLDDLLGARKSFEDRRKKDSERN